MLNENFLQKILMTFYKRTKYNKRKLDLNVNYLNQGFQNRVDFDKLKAIINKGAEGGRF